MPLIAKWVTICLLLSPIYSYSQESILAVLSSDNRIHKKFYSSLEAELYDNAKIVKVTASDVSYEMLNQHDFIVTIGTHAAKIVSEYKVKSSVVHSLIPDNESTHFNSPCRNDSCYYVYINQPAIRYTKLFKILFPQEKTMVLVTTKTDTKLARNLKKSSKITDVTYKEITIQKDGNIARIFTNKLSQNDVLLALPNTAIYNSKNAKSILLSTYHKNVPIIAYSKAFVKAGAIAGLYSSVDHIATKTSKLINEIIKHGQHKQKDHYPDDFTVEVNLAVANSLGINILSENIIKEKLNDN